MAPFNTTVRKTSIFLTTKLCNIFYINVISLEIFETNTIQPTQQYACNTKVKNIL